VKFGTGSEPVVHSPVPNFTFIGATCRPCGAKKRGEKPIFGPLSKNNTGMAALCAGLSVMNIYLLHPSQQWDTVTTLPEGESRLMEQRRLAASA